MELIEAAKRHPGELVLVAIGPLTNLALACKLDPTFPHNGVNVHPPLSCKLIALQQ